MAKIKVDIEEICDLIIEGKSFREICQIVGASLSTLHDFCTKRPEHSTKYRLALDLSANAYADKAEQVLLNLPDDATTAQIAKMKSLSGYYMWLASKRNPMVYSDKLAGQLDLNVTKKKEFKVKIAKRPDGQTEAIVEGESND